MKARYQFIGEANEPDVMAEMNATPLIDVMLVLLIMLIITIPIQNHAVALQMPGNTERLDPPPEAVTIDVDFDNRLTWNGTEVSGKSDLEARLQRIGTQAVEAQPEIHLRPNKLAEYKAVAAVLASAQRLGVMKIGVVGYEQFL